VKLPLKYDFRPARSPSNQLVVVLHGRGDSYEGFLWLQDALGIDSLDYLLLNAPMPYYTGFSWYELPPDQLPGINESRRLLKEVFAETERHGYPPKSTYLFGFSQGCLLTLEFGARHHQRLGGYIGISGYCHDTAALLQELNPEVNQGDWLVTHGTEDDVLSVATTRPQIQVLNDAGFKIDYREYAKSHTIDPDRELPDIRDWLNARIET
jgi:phospholipase/carboxylesterase